MAIHVDKYEGMLDHSDIIQDNYGFIPMPGDDQGGTKYTDKEWAGICAGNAIEIDYIRAKFIARHEEG